MKNKRTLTITTIIIALAILATFGIFQNTKPVQAQEVPPTGKRISFGMAGITAGQTMRASVTCLARSEGDLPPDPCRVLLNYSKANGQLVRNRNGEVIRRSVELRPGDSTFLDVDFGETPPPVGDRLQLRAVVTLPPPIGDQPPPIPDIVATVEVINNSNGRTQFAISALPAVQRVSPPIGDQPSGQ